MIRFCAFSDEAASDLSGQIDALHRNRIDLTELRSIDGKNVSDLTLKEAESYSKALSAEGIRVWSIGSPLGKVDIDCDFASYLDTVKHVAELANCFGTDKIRAFSFYHAYGQRERVIEYMERMAEAVKPYGVTLYHENEKDIFGDSLARVRTLMISVKGWKWVYDPANFLQAGENATDTLDALHSVTDYFHIKDFIVSTGELVPAGYGDGNISELVRRIHDDKVLTVEPHLAVFDAYKAIDKTEMKLRFHFDSCGDAFDAAVDSLRKIVLNAGYTETEGGFIK